MSSSGTLQSFLSENTPHKQNVKWIKRTADDDSRKLNRCLKQHSCGRGKSSNWQGGSWASGLRLFIMFSISPNDENTPFSSTWTHMESGFSSLQGSITDDTSWGRIGFLAMTERTGHIRKMFNWWNSAPSCSFKSSNKSFPRMQMDVRD